MFIYIMYVYTYIMYIYFFLLKKMSWVSAQVITFRRRKKMFLILVSYNRYQMSNV